MRIRVENLTRRFGRNVALDQVSFAVPSGSVYGFVGPNGAGKTTAIRIMAGLDQPDSGQVYYDDLPAVEYPEKALRFIGFMPDTLADSRDIRVWEYLDFFARACGLKGAEKEKALVRVGELTNLENLSERFLGELSKGMKQQVSLARILLHEPAVLLLDEPAAGMNPQETAELADFVRQIRKKYDLTVFLIEHHMDLVMNISDYIYVIDFGSEIAKGVPKEVQNNQRVIEAYLGVTEEESGEV